MFWDVCLPCSSFRHVSFSDGRHEPWLWPERHVDEPGNGWVHTSLMVCPCVSSPASLDVTARCLVPRSQLGYCSAGGGMGGYASGMASAGGGPMGSGLGNSTLPVSFLYDSQQRTAKRIACAVGGEHFILTWAACSGGGMDRMGSSFDRVGMDMNRGYGGYGTGTAHMGAVMSDRGSGSKAGCQIFVRNVSASGFECLVPSLEILQRCSQP